MLSVLIKADAALSAYEIAEQCKGAIAVCAANTVGKKSAANVSKYVTKVGTGEIQCDDVTVSALVSTVKELRNLTQLNWN